MHALKAQRTIGILVQIKECKVLDFSDTERPEAKKPVPSVDRAINPASPTIRYWPLMSQPSDVRGKR